MKDIHFITMLKHILFINYLAVHKIVLGPHNYATLNEALDHVFQMDHHLNKTTKMRRYILKNLNGNGGVIMFTQNTCTYVKLAEIYLATEYTREDTEGPEPNPYQLVASWSNNFSYHLQFWQCAGQHSGFPWWLSGKESAWQGRRYGFDPWVGKIPWRGKRQPTPVFLPGKFLEWRSLVGYSPWDRKETQLRG